MDLTDTTLNIKYQTMGVVAAQTKALWVAFMVSMVCSKDVQFFSDQPKYLWPQKSYSSILTYVLCYASDVSLYTYFRP